MEGSGRTARVAIAGAILVAGGLAIVFALRSGSSEDPSSEEPGTPSGECIDHWNENPLAIRVGRHSYGGQHEYRSVQVLAGTQRSAGDQANPASYSCTVVFPRPTPDPEPEAAVQVFIKPTWTSMFGRPGVRPEDLSELQREAVSGANARLNPDGSIARL